MSSQTEAIAGLLAAKAEDVRLGGWNDCHHRCSSDVQPTGRSNHGDGRRVKKWHEWCSMLTQIFDDGATPPPGTAEGAVVGWIHVRGSHADGR
jgi:hypothetical protein